MLAHLKKQEQQKQVVFQDVTTDGLLSCYKDRPTCLANDMPAEVGIARDLSRELTMTYT